MRGSEIKTQKEYIYCFSEIEELIVLKIPPPSLDLPLILSIDGVDFDYLGFGYYIGEL